MQVTATDAEEGFGTLSKFLHLNMIKLYSPKNEVDLAIIRSLLDSEGIPYFVHNDHFGSLKIGPQIDIFNAKTIMIGEQDGDRAKDLLTDYLKNIEDKREKQSARYSFFDKIRMLVEVVLFMWIMPGRSRKKKENTERKSHHQGLYLTARLIAA